jgi:ADP-heptose:LPS heptosyltransferase
VGHDSAATRSWRPRVLLTRPDHLGDVLLTLGAAAALRDALPTAHLAYAVAPRMREAVAHCPYVDEIHPVRFPPPTAESNPPGWAGRVAREASKLRGRFDIGLVLRPDDPWSGALLAAAGIPVRLGYDLKRTRPFLTQALVQPPRRHAVLLAVDLAAAAATCLDTTVTSSAQAPLAGCFVPTRTEQAEAEKILAETGVRRPVILHPGSGWQLKNWPAHRWGEVAAKLSISLGMPPLIIGGPTETELVQAAVAESQGQAKGLAGRLCLGGLAALHRRAQMVIGTDSGPLHLAAMMGTPVIGLYGPADPLVFHPWAPPHQHRVLRVDLPCSPCGTLEHPPCGAVIHPRCVTDIPSAAVLTAATELLHASG